MGCEGSSRIGREQLKRPAFRHFSGLHVLRMGTVKRALAAEEISITSLARSQFLHMLSVIRAT